MHDNAHIKKAFADAYTQTLGNISESCKAVGISRQTYYTWLNKDEDFAEKIKSIEPEELLLDMIDNALVQKVLTGDTTALIFLAKTKGKKRGYIERQEVSMETKAQVIIMNDDGKEADFQDAGL